MTDRRQPYEFSYETKQEALRRSPVCEICGKPETKNDPFECNHKIAIWFALENPCLIPEVVRSISNLQVVHRSCHRQLHQNETRTFYKELAPSVLLAYLETIVDPHKDDWRDKLKEKHERKTTNS